eukprot:INCI12875.2.p1 GENE.INCI12875.2~~INCI12875.2.p1  ORF type:complete len:495 (+),score=73.82 INCI12875.2:46-1530(+)
MNIDLFLVFWFFVFYYFPILGCGFPSTPLRVLMLRLQVLVLKRTRRCSCPGFVASALPTKVNNLCRLSARLFSSKLEGAEEEEEEGLESRRGEEEQLRRSARRFVASALEPNIATWEQQRRIPREVYRQAGELGLLQVGFAEPWGYGGDDPHLMIALQEELCQTGAGGLVAGLSSHFISMPPILAMGTQELIDRVAVPVLAGQKVGALAVTEPGAGSDVASIRTRATLDASGSHFIVNGEKTFITSGVHADFYTVVVRTGTGNETRPDERTDPRSEISLLLVERGTPGFTQTPLSKMGWHCSDTATLHFDNTRVPRENLIGNIGGGFKGLMLNFNMERLMLAAQATFFSQVAYNEAREWVTQRHAFGSPLVDKQVVRHRLVDMASAIATSRAFLFQTADRMAAAKKRARFAGVRSSSPAEDASLVADICLLKNHCTSQMEFVATNAVQLLGGMGYMTGTKSERIFRETKVQQIGGGSTEVMKDLAAKQLGIGKY